MSDDDKRHSLSGSLSMMYTRAASELEPIITKFTSLGRRAPSYITDTLPRLKAHSRAPGRREGQSPYADEDGPRHLRMAELKDELAQQSKRLSDKEAAEAVINEEDDEGDNPRDGDLWQRDVDRIRKGFPRWQARTAGD